MFHPDLIHPDIELFGQHHAGAGIDALSHLDVRHHQPHQAVGIDADEGIGSERRIAVGRSRGGVARLTPRIDRGARRPSSAGP